MDARYITVIKKCESERRELGIREIDALIDIETIVKKEKGILIDYNVLPDVYMPNLINDYQYVILYRELKGIQRVNYHNVELDIETEVGSKKLLQAYERNIFDENEYNKIYRKYRWRYKALDYLLSLWKL